MTPGQETPVTGPKKITIHVGGSRGSAAASPAPQTSRPSDLGRPDGPQDANRGIYPAAPNTTAASFQVDLARTVAGAVPSPRPSVVAPMPGMGAQQPSGAFPRPNGHVPGAPNGMPTPTQNFQPAAPGALLQNGHPPPAPVTAPPIYDEKYRAPGRGRPSRNTRRSPVHHLTDNPPGLSDALLPSVLVRTHPSVAMDHRFRLEIPAHPQEAHQNFTIHIPGNHGRLQLIPRLALFEQQNRAYRLFVTVNGQTVGRATPLPVPDDPLPPNAIVFDLNLPLITSVIVVTVIAALPKGQKLPSGADCEVEKVVLNAQLLRMY